MKRVGPGSRSTPGQDDSLQVDNSDCWRFRNGFLLVQMAGCPADGACYGGESAG
jgi:hypothetical protein